MEKRLIKTFLMSVIMDTYDNMCPVTVADKLKVHIYS